MRVYGTSCCGGVAHEPQNNTGMDKRQQETRKGCAWAARVGFAHRSVLNRGRPTAVCGRLRDRQRARSSTPVVGSECASAAADCQSPRSNAPLTSCDGSSTTTHIHHADENVPLVTTPAAATATITAIKAAWHPCEPLLGGGGGGGGGGGAPASSSLSISASVKMDASSCRSRCTSSCFSLGTPWAVRQTGRRPTVSPASPKSDSAIARSEFPVRAEESPRLPTKTPTRSFPVVVQPRRWRSVFHVWWWSPNKWLQMDPFRTNISHTVMNKVYKIRCNREKCIAVFSNSVRQQIRGNEVLSGCAAALQHVATASAAPIARCVEGPQSRLVLS